MFLRPRLSIVAIAALLLSVAGSTASGQTFTRVTTGPVATDVYRSGGGAWADVNGDGHLDLFTGNGNVTAQINALYLSDGAGGFTAQAAGPVVTDGGSSIGGAWGDFDNDGDPDLFVTNRTPSLNFLYRNLGGGAFERVLDAPVGTDVNDSNMSHWVDVDRDGDLDLFVLNFNSINFMYINDGAGHFTRRTTGVEASTSTLSIACVWGDYNNDGAPDLFVANGGDQNNDLYTNDGAGNFTRTSFSDGRSSLGASWGDIDNDGDLDLFVADFLGQNNLLYVNAGPPSYALTPLNAPPFATDGGRSIGSAWGDVDNDGDLDLYVGNDGELNFLYRNDGGGSFIRLAAGDITSTVSNTFGVNLVDYDDDGDLDAFDANRTDQVNALWRNDGNANAWLRVGLRGTTSNRSGIGARVIVSALIGGSRVRQMREIASQDGYNSQSGLLAFFGLGDAAVADTVTVRWPSGQVDRFTAVPVRRNVILTEGDPDVVPVRLASFTGERIAAGVRLDWRLAEDDGSVRFEIRREDAAGGWLAVGGTAARGLEGTYVDASAPRERTSYRLSALLRDGTTVELGSIEVAAASAPPELGPAAPNPFRDRVTLTVSAAEPGPARIAVFDARGALVRLLHDGWLDAGPRPVTWDGRTDTGAEAAPGVFFIRLDGSTAGAARRVILLGNGVR